MTTKEIVKRINRIMANYESLKTAIINAVYENGNNEVTGQGVQDVLIAIVNALGAGYQFTGVATPATDPGTPDVNVMYIAGAGTYPNFDATKVPQGSFGVFRYNGSWDYSVLDVASWADASNKLYYNTQAGNVAAKTIQADGFTLQPGGWIKIHFDNENEAANPTLNVNNTGAHTMTFNGRTVSLTNSWKAGETVAFYYDNYGVGTWCGIRLIDYPDFVNVNDLIGQDTPFASASAARSAIPQQYRKLGLNITYLLSTGENSTMWITEQFIGDDIDDWTVADNWKVVGPVSVTQNISTGHTDISVGDVTTPVASVNEVSQLELKLSDFPEMEYGTLNNSGQEVASTTNVRTKEYLRAPFCMKIKSGYQFVQAWMYSKSGDTYTFVKKMGSAYYDDSLKVFVSDVSHYYRVVVKILDAPIDSPNDVIDSFESVNVRQKDDGIDELKFVNDVVYPLLPGSVSELSLGTLSDGRMAFDTPIGKIVSSTSVKYTELIPIFSGKQYRVTTLMNLKNDAGVAYFNANSVAPANFLGVDKSFIGDYVTDINVTISKLLTIPFGATYFIVFTRDSSTVKVEEITLTKTASESQLSDKVDKVEGKGLSSNDFTDEDKSKLDSLEPGGVPTEIVEAAVEDYLDTHSGGLIPQNLGINLVPSYTYKLMPSVITDPATLPAGWSGSIAGGLSHTSGNTDALEIDLSGYTLGDNLLVSFNQTGISGASTEVYISQGTKSLIESYNNSSQVIAGFKNDGSNLKLTPASGFEGTITNLKVRKIDADNGAETLTVQEDNLYTTRKKLVAGFWNVGIGPATTMGNAEDITRSVAIGYYAMGGILVGNRNVAIGTYALSNAKFVEKSVAIGSDTIYPTSQDVVRCVAIGKATLTGKGAMNSCVAIGVEAMGSSSTRTTDLEKCVCVGDNAGFAATSKCTHIGYRSGRNSNGVNNTSVGYNALGIGERSTVDIVGTELTCIGYNASVANNATAKAAINSTALGANATITKSNQVVIGDGNVIEFKFGNKILVFNNDNTVTWTTES